MQPFSDLVRSAAHVSPDVRPTIKNLTPPSASDCYQGTKGGVPVPLLYADVLAMSTGTGHQKETHRMEPSLPISLRPSPVTKLRDRLDMPQDVAAAHLGMTVRQLQYLEQHTMRVSSTMLASISVLLGPVVDLHPQTIWDWLAEEATRQASLDESEA